MKFTKLALIAIATAGAISSAQVAMAQGEGATETGITRGDDVKIGTSQGLKPVHLGTFGTPSNDLLIDLYSSINRDDPGGRYAFGTSAPVGGVLVRNQENPNLYKFFDTKGDTRCVGRLEVSPAGILNGKRAITAKWSVDGTASGSYCSTVGKVFTNRNLPLVSENDF